jgi:hypothetical protein
MYNKAGLVYENTSLGKFQFYRWLQSNYYYNKILIRDDKTIPAALTRNINSFGGQYEYQKTNGKEIFSIQIYYESVSI